jgi:hypothetical protein
MRRSGNWPFRVWFGLLALAGIVAGHQASFFVATSDSSHRHALWASTGHGSWASVHAIVLALAVAVVIGFVGALVRSKGASRPPSGRYRWALGRLAVVQVTGFALVEVVERANAGASVAEVLADRILLIGLAVQVVVAALACLILFFISHVVAMFKGLPPQLYGTRPLPNFFSTETRTVALGLTGCAWSLRGPPLSSL